MLKRISRRAAGLSSRSNQPQPILETLEDRQLLAASPHITSVVADNRGWVVLQADAALLASTVTASNVLIYTIGADKKWNTSDDTAVTRSVSWNAKLNQIGIKSKLPANTAYRIKLLGSKIKGANGALLDGEYKGAKVQSGNGLAGGNFDCITKTSPTIYARFITTDGAMTYKLNPTACPKTVANFKLYANTVLQGAVGGVWDNTFFHRLTKLGDTQGNGQPVTYGIIQGGGFGIVNNAVHAEPLAAPITLEATLSNLRGTIAMARTNDPNSATNQWYFNYTDNSALFDHNYAVFGTIVPADLPVLDKLAAHERVDASNDTTVTVGEQIGQTPIYIRSALTDLPVKSAATYNSRGHLDPNADLIRVTRVAMLMATAATPVAAARAVVASPRMVVAPQADAAPQAPATFSQTPVVQGAGVLDDAKDLF